METYVSDPENENPAPAGEGKDKRPDPAPQSNRRILVICVVVLLAALGVWYYLHTQYRLTTDDAQVDGHIIPIAARIPGSVEQVFVTDNQEVKAGDVLLRIDPRDYQVRVDQAKAALALAESQARGAQVSVPLTSETTESGNSVAEAQLAAAEADLNKAKFTAAQAAGADLSYAQANIEAHQADYDRAQADLARMKPLAAKAEISQQQFDAYVAAAKVAESQLKAAQQQLQSARQNAESKQAAALAALADVQRARAVLAQSQANRKQVTISAAQASSASAAVQQARASLEAAELQLSYTELKAPVDGVVTKKTVQLGQILQPGQSLMTLVPLRDVWITANFKETQLRDVHSGQKAEVEVDTYGRSFYGRVDSIAGATGGRQSLLPPENATGNYVKVVERIPVKILLDPLPAGYVLRPGMNVSATIFTR